MSTAPICLNPVKQIDEALASINYCIDTSRVNYVNQLKPYTLEVEITKAVEELESCTNQGL